MYYARTKEGEEPQPLVEHLEQVAQLAQGFAAIFGAADLGYSVGLYHDIGKYSKEFQDRLFRNRKRVDHATAGGKEMMKLAVGTEMVKLAGRIGSYCVMGHHTGLPDGGTKYDQPGDHPKRQTLCARMKKEVCDYSDFSIEIAATTLTELPVRKIGQDGFTFSFFTRMLFSCLVDADFLDAENFTLTGESFRRTGESVEILCEKMARYTAPFFNNSAPKGSLNETRTMLLRDALVKAKEEKGLFSLAIPTGGGKTITSLAFSLEHAKANSQDRVIYVAPFTTIIDQNASVFAEILGEENVIQHHSNVNYDKPEDKEEDEEEDDRDYRYLATENWDAPVIVTTTSQFFESFFARKNSKCRKLHNVANSVLVFDEIQALPREYIKPCLAVLTELTLNYGCTVVLCTATQPAFQELLPMLPIREIVSDREDLYQHLKRVTIQHLGKQSDEELSAKLEKLPQVLCIVNTRRQAQELYSSLPKEGSYHLSTLLYPKDRLRMLAEIRERLKADQPCRVVSTSLVEAGVDLDFPTVYRGQTGLDSLIQAAGRCNREGRRSKEESIVYYFQEEDYSVPWYLRKPISIMNMILRDYADCTSLDAIHQYFSDLYAIDELDSESIMELLEQTAKNHRFPFVELERRFRLIKENTVTILIPLEKRAKELLGLWEKGIFSRRTLREMQQYSVQVYDNHRAKLLSLGMLEPLDLDEELYVLRDLSAYDSFLGLALEPTTGDGIIL